MKRILIFLLIFACGFATALAINKFLFLSVNKQKTAIRLNSDFNYINPLLECDLNIANDKNLNLLKKDIEQYLSERSGNYSIYFRDLNNGPWFGINEKEKFSPASLIKVPLMMAYFKLAENNPEILKMTIVNQIDSHSYYAQQNIKPQTVINLGQSYTIEDLITKMIIDSDNLAYELLLENIDNKLIFQVYSDVGLAIEYENKYNPSGDIISVKDYASFFRILYNASYLNKNYSEKALQILAQTTYKKGLVAGVSSNYKIAHKFGERQYLDNNEVQLHDCGIVYSEKPYLLCIMSRGSSFDELASSIRKISEMVFLAGLK